MTADAAGAGLVPPGVIRLPTRIRDCFDEDAVPAGIRSQRGGHAVGAGLVPPGVMRLSAQICLQRSGPDKSGPYDRSDGFARDC